MDNVNWFSMVLATITPIGLGLIYYPKALFGNVWKDSIGRTDNKVNKVVTLIVAIAFSFLLSLFLLGFNNDGINQEGDFDTFAHGAWHGAVVAIAIVTPVIVMNGWFGQRAWKNMLINIVFWIITLALMGGILDAMNHWENIPMPE